MYKKGLIIALFLSLSVSLSACKKPNNPGAEPVTPPDPGVVTPPVEEPKEMEKMIWIDAHANLQRFNSQANIRHFLDKIKDTGFNKIVVDVKPCQGDVLYDSAVLPKATTIGGDTNAVLNFDYLGYFIEQAKKRGLKVTVSTTFFTMGSANTQMGPAFTDPKWEDASCVQYTPEGLTSIKDDKSKVAVFLNPVLPEVQECLLTMVEELLTKYDFDAYALDYCRYCDYQSDYSEASHKAFEEYLGTTVNNFPSSIFTYNASGGIVPGTYFRQWWAFRAKVISDFVGKVHDLIKEKKPEVKLEYWAASWWHAIYGNGQNWASPDYYESQLEGPYNWYSKAYAEAGFAKKIDTFLLGAYLSRIEGAYDAESIEYAINRANKLLNGDCAMYATVQCADKNFDIQKAVQFCMENSEGLMVFDLCHVISTNAWEKIKTGIAAAEANLANKE